MDSLITPPTTEEVIHSLKAVSDTTELKEFLPIIKQMLEEVGSDKGSRRESAKEKHGMWTSFVTSGQKFLDFVKDHKPDNDSVLKGGIVNIVADDILGKIGQLYCVPGGLAIAAYLIEKFENSCSAEMVEVLSNMVDLAKNFIESMYKIPQEKEIWKTVAIVILQASIYYAYRMSSAQSFQSDFMASVDLEISKEMSKRLHHVYRDLEIKLSIFLPVPKPFYPKDAVGIRKAQEDVISLLYMTTEDESPLVVIIYGFGGMGKTTLATSVVAMLNLEGYNYVRVDINEDQSQNDLKKLQEVILKEAFPRFHSGAPTLIRDCKDGRERLAEAFPHAENKPVFLYIDNALRREDLKELLPEKLSGLPKSSKILVTTRTLDATNVFETSGVACLPFVMKPLDKHDAVQILCNDADNLELIKDDLERILRICGGVPLALRTVRGYLLKFGYNAEKCRQLLDALERGDDEENLSQRLLGSAYSALEDGAKEGFLDICWFFNGWLRPHVEYVVGAEVLTSLENAGLVTRTPLVDNDDMRRIYPIYDGEDLLIVPDILRARGRAISTSTRFTDVQSFYEAAKDEAKVKGIKGLWFHNEEKECVIDEKHLNSVRHSLRILSLGEGTKTSAEKPMKFKELRYLGVADDAVPHRLMMLEELDKLGVYAGPIGPNGITMSKLSQNLSMIVNTSSQIATSEESSSTQVIQNHSLQELHLWGEKIREFPDGLSQLRSLKILSLLYYTEIEEFPAKVCELSHLIKLRIYRWKRLKRLSQSFGQLKGLTHLQISYCDELEELPSSFGELTALKHLTLSFCPKLKQLPDGLERLRYLDVRGCEHLSLEPKLKELSSFST